MCRPSGENATDLTESLCPDKRFSMAGQPLSPPARISSVLG
jgi:hypothetical protein